MTPTRKRDLDRIALATLQLDALRTDQELAELTVAERAYVERQAREISETCRGVAAAGLDYGVALAAVAEITRSSHSIAQFLER